MCTLRGILILLMTLMCISSYAYDPTQPPEMVQKYYKLTRNITEDDSIEYKMYMAKGDKPYAVLGQQLLTIGEKYENMEVMGITKDAVVLQTVDGVRKFVPIINSISSKSEDEDQAENESEDEDQGEGEDENEESSDDEDSDDE